MAKAICVHQVNRCAPHCRKLGCRNLDRRRKFLLHFPLLPGPICPSNIHLLVWLYYNIIYHKVDTFHFYHNIHPRVTGNIYSIWNMCNNFQTFIIRYWISYSLCNSISYIFQMGRSLTFNIQFHPTPADNFSCIWLSLECNASSCASPVYLCNQALSSYLSNHRSQVHLWID